MRTWFKTVWTGVDGKAMRVEFWTRIRAFEGQGPRDHHVTVDGGDVIGCELIRVDGRIDHVIATTTKTSILREARRMSRTAL